MAFLGEAGDRIMRRTPGGPGPQVVEGRDRPVWRNSWIFFPDRRADARIARMPSGRAKPGPRVPPPPGRLLVRTRLEGVAERIESRSAYSRRTASTASFARGMLSLRRSDDAEQPESNAFWVCIVLRLVPHDRVRPSITSSVISCPRWAAGSAGRHVALRRLDLVLVERVAEHERALVRLASCPMLAHTSV